MELIEGAVISQTPRPTCHIGPETNPRHSFQSRVQWAASDTGHEGMEIQVSLDERSGLTCQDGPISLLEHQVQVELLALRSPAGGCTGCDRASDHRPQLMELAPVRSALRDAQYACGSLSSGDENADSVADVDHPEIRQRRQSFPHDRQADLQLNRQLPGRFNSLTWSEISDADPPPDLVGHLRSQWAPRCGIEISRQSPEIEPLPRPAASWRPVPGLCCPIPFHHVRLQLFKSSELSQALAYWRMSLDLPPLRYDRSRCPPLTLRTSHSLLPWQAKPGNC
jgi:hypothetical protein